MGIPERCSSRENLAGWIVLDRPGIRKVEVVNMRSLASLPNDEYQLAVEALAEELEAPPVRGQLVTWKGEQFRLNRKTIANIHQAHADQAPDPLPSYSGGECQYPHFFDTDACCICGDLDVNACPCTTRDVPSASGTPASRP